MTSRTFAGLATSTRASTGAPAAAASTPARAPHRVADHHQTAFGETVVRRSRVTASTIVTEVAHRGEGHLLVAPVAPDVEEEHVVPPRTHGKLAKLKYRAVAGRPPVGQQDQGRRDRSGPPPRLETRAIPSRVVAPRRGCRMSSWRIPRSGTVTLGSPRHRPNHRVGQPVQCVQPTDGRRRRRRPAPDGHGVLREKASAQPLQRPAHVDRDHRAPPLGIDDDVLQRMALLVGALGQLGDHASSSSVRPTAISPHPVSSRGREPSAVTTPSMPRTDPSPVQLRGHGHGQEREVDRLALAELGVARPGARPRRAGCASP